MYNHAPQDYECPICLGVHGIESDKTLLRQSDIVYKDDLVTCFINSFFIGNNPGHVIVVPNKHFENIYDLPDNLATHIQQIAKNITLAIKKAYSAEGITILQNNEPAGNQHAFHYHMHIFPRYTNDELHQHMSAKKSTTSEERNPYVEKVKNALLSL